MKEDSTFFFFLENNITVGLKNWQGLLYLLWGAPRLSWGQEQVLQAQLSSLLRVLKRYFTDMLEKATRIKQNDTLSSNLLRA